MKMSPEVVLHEAYGPGLDELKTPSAEREAHLQDQIHQVLQTISELPASPELLKLLETTAQRAAQLASSQAAPVPAVEAQNPRRTNLPVQPSVQYPVLAHFRELHERVERLEQRSYDIADEAREHFGKVSVATTLDRDERIIRVPTFPAADDPVQSLFSRSAFLGSPFIDREQIPCLNKLSVRIWGVTWKPPEGMSEDRMDTLLYTSDEVAFGPESDVHEEFSRPLATLCCTLSPGLESKLWDMVRTAYGSNFFRGVLQNEGFEDADWKRIFSIFKEKGRERGLFVDTAQLSGGQEQYYCIGGYPRHNLYVVLELFQESLREAYNQPQQGFTLLKTTAKPVEISDVGMDAIVDIYGAKTGICEVLSELENATTEQNRMFGISHELARWMVAAVKEYEYALKGKPSRFSPPPLGATNETIWNAPQYFQDFVTEVASSSKTKTDRRSSDSWRENALSALTTLELSLSTYANRHMTL
jgi:hypothetical protein